MTAATGGTLLASPCGSSTITYAMPWSARKRSTRSATVGAIQRRLRNSTASFTSGSRARASSSVSRPSLFGTCQRGYCMSTAPIFPASISGCSAARNVAQISSTISGGRSFA